MSQPKRVLRLGATEGNGEKRSKPYKQYGARVSKPVTQRSAKRVGRVFGSAEKQANPTQKPFAVFDIDGTLIRWQLYHAVVDGLAKHGLINKHDYQKLRDSRFAWKQRVHPEAFGAYEKELVRAYERALPDIPPKTFDDIAEAVAEEYKTQVYTYTRNLIKSLKAQGYVLLAISGSHNELVGHVAQQYGFDDWIGTIYERGKQGFTGKKVLGSRNKELTLTRLVKKHGLTFKDSYAVGDSLSDAALLAQVENPIAFNPDKELLKKAKAENWMLVIERKNVVYKLEPQDGKYVLA